MCRLARLRLVLGIVPFFVVGCADGIPVVDQDALIIPDSGQIGDGARPLDALVPRDGSTPRDGSAQHDAAAGSPFQEIIDRGLLRYVDTLPATPTRTTRCCASRPAPGSTRPTASGSTATATT